MIHDTIYCVIFVAKCYLVSQSSFGIGYRFYYWRYYKDTFGTEELQPANNRYDHGGYDTIELFVASKYKSIKDELINNQFYSLSRH